MQNISSNSLSHVGHVNNDKILFQHHVVSDISDLPFRAHAHDKWEFMLLPESNNFCVIEEKRYQLRNSVLIMIKPTQIHRIQFGGHYPYEYYSLMCSMESLFPSESVQLLSAPSVYQIGSDSEVLQLFFGLLKQHAGRNAQFHCELSWVQMKEIVSEVLCLWEQKKMVVASPINPILRDAIKYIEDNIAKTFRIDDLCAAVGLTRDKLYNMFITHMLLAPSKYIRMKK